MVDFSITDETFEPNISISYFLSIRLNPDGLSFCTLDPVRNKYIQISHIVFNETQSIATQLNDCLSKSDILNLPFKRTFILIPSQISTLVPAAVFEPEKKEELLKFSCSIPENSTIYYNKIRSIDTFNIFSIPTEVEVIMQRQFPEPLFFHQNTPFIDSILSATLTEESTTTLLCINFNSDFFDIVVFDKDRLMLCNSFPIKSENDFIYFTLFVFEQLKLSEPNTMVQISGIHPDKQRYIKQLSNYLGNIRQIDFPRHFRYSILFRDTRISGFFNLLNLPVCV